MAKSGFLLFLCISVLFMLSMNLSSGSVEEDRKVYIAYLGSVPQGEYFLSSSHHITMLQGIFKHRSVEKYLLRSYTKSFNGFAAKLTDEEAKKIASMKGVVSVFPSKVYHLQTTRSWDFMGFNETVKRDATVESNVIVGVIDSGIWPESESFSDKGFSPPPQKWKGSCNGGQNFTCNNKVIGARDYTSETARDLDGHGTHTASTAAGNNVESASFFGLGNGTARGAVPSARIAAYKACATGGGCASDAILAAFDDAIADGVDLITISIGADSADRFSDDSVAIGAFHAAERGILTVQSAGNGGIHGLQSVSSVAPWILSVAASSTDRHFVDKVVLGNGKTITGLSINSFSLNGTKFPLAYGLQVAHDDGCDAVLAGICDTQCLNASLVKNKILLCDGGDPADRGPFNPLFLGAVGAIIPINSFNFSGVTSLPASALSEEDYDSVKSYQNTTKQPEAEILRSESIEDSTAPVVARFSSRGPNLIVQDILKPDISAPGVEILAAYSQAAPPSLTTLDQRRVKYNILSGTSMSCPHAAGVAVYVKTIHPDWSPSAIRSAIMTTASPMDSSNNPDAEFAYGSGHVNPVKAIDPGLVYDNVKGDNLRFLCSIGYDEARIRQMSGDNSTCPENSANLQPRDFNYPSLAAFVVPGVSFTVGFQRTVTNVGVATSTYNASVSSNSILNVKVIPEILSFKSLNEKLSYNVTVEGKALNKSSMVSASLVWSDGTHTVRSPIVIHTIRGIIP